MKKTDLIFLFFFFPLYVFSQEICDNGIDDDGDGLIDLNDFIDCSCVDSDLDLVANPSFEQYSTCPLAVSQMNLVDDWFRPGRATSDYFNTCGLTGYFDSENNPGLIDPDLPLPGALGGSGYVGFIASGWWSEAVAECLTSPMLAGEKYCLNTWIAAAGGFSLVNNLDLAVFGNVDCAAMKWTGNGCNSNLGNQLIGSEVISFTKAGEWINVTIELLPTTDINGIVIGPSCSFTEWDQHLYYMDEVNIMTCSPGYYVEPKGSECTNDLVLNTTLTDPLFTKQWYLDGVALVSETGASLNVSVNNYGFGKYTLVYTNTNTGQCKYIDYHHVSNNSDVMVQPIHDEKFCFGDVLETTFRGKPGVIFDWTNSNTTIGLAAAGTGNIPSFITPVNTSTPEVAIIEVTPSLGSCVGATETFTLTGVPKKSPLPITYPSLTLCGTGPAVLPIIAGGTVGLWGLGDFESTPAGLDFWTNNGRIDPSASTPGNYEITLIPSAYCSAISKVNVTISNAPSINPINDQVICSENDFTAMTFTGSPGAIYNWTNTNTGIGLAAAGVGDIPAFSGLTAIGSEVATIEVTASVGSCSGSPQTFDLTVNPKSVTSFNYAELSYCSSDPPVIPTITGTQGGTFSSTPAGLSVDAITGEITPNLSISGNYSVNYSLASGCAATSTFNISILETPIVSPISNQTICVNNDFTAVVFTGSAGATFDWTNSNAAIGLSVNGVGDISAFSGTATGASEVGVIEVTPSLGSCMGTSEIFTLTVNSFNDPSFNYTSPSFCVSEAPISPNITGTLGGNFSSVPVGLSIDPVTGEITPSSSTIGNYIVTYNLGGCSGSSEVDIIITNGPVVDPIGDQVICVNENFTDILFTGSGGAIFDWTNTNTAIGLVASGIGNISSFTGIVSGANEVGVIEVTPSIGSCIGASELFTLTVNQANDPSFNYTSLSLCVSEAPISPNITGTLGGNFSSVPVGLSIDPVTGEITPSSSTIGNYVVTYNIGATCIASSAVNITILPPPTADFVQDQIICNGEYFTAINFTGTARTFDWTNTNTAIGLAASGKGSISAFQGIASGNIATAIIEVIPSKSACSGAPLTFELGVNTLPVILFEADALKGCAPLTVNFSNLSPVPGNCLWDFGNGKSTTTPNCSGASFTYDQSGIYDVTFSVTNAEGCTSTTQINNYINVIPRPTASFSMSPDKITSDQTTIEFSNASTNATTYNWNFGDGTISSKENSSHKFTIGDDKSRTITLWAHNAYCSDSIQNIIKVIEDLVFYVPNAFTPDGDGINQTFQPVFTSGFNPDDYHLTIFSRWGEVIFESFNSEIGWDGMYGNIGLVQDGVYTWKIVFADGVTDKKHERIGSVVLLK